MLILNQNHHQSLGYVNQRLRDNRELPTFLLRIPLRYSICREDGNSFTFRMFFLLLFLVILHVIPVIRIFRRTITLTLTLLSLRVNDHGDHY